MANIPEMEIVQHRDLDAKEAREITTRIKEGVADVMVLVAKAWQGRVWVALGYEDWPDYLAGEFDRAPLYLPRDERRAVSSLLSSKGMSTRAIGAATGTGDATVRRDLATAPNGAVKNERARVTGLDGRVTCPNPRTGPREPTPEPEAPRPAPQPPEPVAQPAPPEAPQPRTVVCPTCGGTGEIEVTP